MTSARPGVESKLWSMLSAENNLVWSIAAKLKGEAYLSEYQPREDPGVARHLRRLAAGMA
jgi:hypothetical protein